MGCNCDDNCPKNNHCACIFSYDDNTCNCDCWGPITLGADRTQIAKKSLNARIDICVKNVELATLGELLSKHCDAELLIPASKARTLITMSEKDMSLSTAIEKTGLRIG